MAIPFAAPARALTALLTASAVLAGGLVFAPAAAADTQPQPGTPETVSSDMLPTVQIDGIVWTQKIVGNTVFAGGSFANARPAGAAAGTNQTPRANLLAYDIRTGALITSFAPTFNGVVRALEVSPDGTQLYVGGDFTVVNGQSRSRIAAVDVTTGALNPSFRPVMNNTVHDIAVSGGTVYAAGNFTAVGSTSRLRGAALAASNGAVLPFAASMDARARAVVVSPDGSKVVFGGHFTTLNGLGGPNVGDDAGFGLGAVDAVSGAYLPLNVGKRVKNATPDSAIWSLDSDSDSFYGTGYHFGDVGNLEGTFRADWSTGNLVWVEDCHGDTYDSTVTNGVVYIAGHPHYCGTSGGFPQTEPWTTQRALAWTKAPSGQVANGDTLGYPSWEGEPIPTLLTWYPDFYTGRVSGSGQAAWSVESNSQYVVFGGEFPGVNQAAQQGLVRFAVKSIAPNKDAPRLSGANWTPSVSSYVTGTVRVGWLANHDRDNEFLTYELLRDGQVVHTTQAGSKAWWFRPQLGYLDTGLTPGASLTYQVRAKDPYGNQRLSAPVSVTVASDGSVSDYANAVLDDGANTFWRLGDAAGSTTAIDWAGFNDGRAGTGVGFGQSGAINGDANTAAAFSGDGNGLVATTGLVQGTNTFGLEAWFNTTSTSGGKIVGFGNSNTGNSSNYDRHIFMDGSGRVYFGVYPGSTQTVQSVSGLNDGQWHHVAASLSSAGMELYIDGVRVARRTDVTTAQSYSGYWRVGGDSTWAGDNYFDGKIDDVAIYDQPLTRDQVRDHYTLSGRSTSSVPVPTDAYGAAIYNSQPELYWRLDESSSATAVIDYSGNGNGGTYAGGVTKPVAGALTGNPSTAASFDGSDDGAYSNARFSNPTTYSLELWFKSDSTSGGKLIGFGGNQTGLSQSHDRSVFLQSDGRIVFGTWTGFENRITTSSAYNDNRWHYVVATQSSEGMRLYVDGALAGTNPQTGAEATTNYWRIGGDTTWGGTNSAYIRSVIDEVAVYSRALTATEVQSHYDKALPANTAPTASFSFSSTDRSASFDASASADADGSITSYAWSFGDGSTGTGATPSHTYAKAGTYSVKLTVTDNRGATNETARLVTVTAPAGPADAYGAAVVADAPLLYWRLGEQSGDSTAADSSGSGNPGTYRGNVTKPVEGAIAATGNTAARFDGWEDLVSSDRAFSNPTTYSVEVWFRTSSTSGGKLIGFGNSQTGTSSGYDRHIYMQDNGQLVFGTWVGFAATVVSPASYNDGQWHHVVATQSSAGQRLYVDGALVGSNGEANAQPYDGYWRIGGDWTWGSSSPWFNGDLDEAAVYGTALSAEAVATHYDLADSNAPANEAPTAAFEASATGFSVTVDGSNSTDPDGQIAKYEWDFGDGATGSGATENHTYATAGTYDVVLTVTDDDGATGKLTKQVTITPANVAPTASFTSSATGLTVTVDGSASSDSDGSIASYEWAFGDDSTATGATATHTYAAGGTFEVTLTVTDDDGSRSSTTKSVTVTAPNAAPVADFSVTASNLGVTVNGSTSSDSDGSIASHTWTFGDGNSGTGATTAHTYAAAGTYDITLTVTDDDGATTALTKAVTVTAPPATAELARDAFERTLASGLGSAEVGGAWTLVGPATRYSVSGGTGRITSNAGSTMRATLESVSSADTEVQVTVSTAQAITGGSHYVSVIGRRIGTDDYRARLVIGTNGAVTLQLQRNGTTLTSGVLTGVTYATGDQIRVRLQVTGTSPTTIRAKAWKVGTTEPANWRLTTTDSTAGYQVPGGVGIATYLNASATTAVTTTFDDLWAGPTGSTPTPPPPPQNVAPTASFTASTSDLTVSVDGAGSSDSDGTITGYLWDFGDGASATTAQAQHPYAAAGTYQVKLTVTDNAGATHSMTQPVTVTAPTPPPTGVLAADDFNRTASGGWGTAATGGAWTTPAPASYYSVDGTGRITTAAGGKTVEAYLNGVSSTATEVRTVVGLSSLPVGGSVYASVVGRRVGTADYRVRVVVAPSGGITLQLQRAGTTLRALVVPGLTLAAGETLQLRLQVTGTGDTTLRAMAWKTGATQPVDWQVVATDSTAALQAPGGVGLAAYFGGGITSLPSVISFDDLVVTAVP
ncbi:PKD domain-containing protein [Naasia sp. SYSU D00948]|uniref:PKD domain-containing protein n=1 Tax=Naasia sp. SYSU D00948 TaxID=2817379 RepID=UPI001B30077F|nr:PKD domain-containing protein [Naasia sp. SYSU D00948]